MSTYGALKTRIALELNSTLTSADSEITDAINTAILKYDADRFRWNEGQETFAAVQGTAAYSLFAAKTFTDAEVSAAADTITVQDHGWTTGTALRLTHNSPPGGLATATVYYAIRVDADTLKLATTQANALAGTAVNITTAGAGTGTLTPLRTWAVIDSIVLVASGSFQPPLEQMDYARIEEMNAGGANQGQPWAWAWLNDQVYFYPVPQSAYTVQVRGIAKLDPFANDTDTNGWTEAGEPLTRNAALVELCDHFTNEPDRAQTFRGYELAALAKLRLERNELKRTGTVRRCGL